MEIIYHEVLDENQSILSLRWVVITEEKKVNARLVARGFEQQINEASVSPTITKDTISLFFALCCSLSCNVECLLSSFHYFMHKSQNIL